MNQHARRLGMTQSTFVNPNGLPADDQISSARDLAILARALIREFPEYDYYWHIPAIKMGKAVQRNYNTLIGRYPGADGMKTGFICASGFNLLASATRDNRRLIAVVLGAPSSQARALKAAQLLERGFNSNGALSWLMPSLGTVDTMQPVNAAPPNLREEMCGPHRKRQATEDEDDVVAANVTSDSPYAVFLSSLRPKTKGANLLSEGTSAGEPVVVYTGPFRKPGTVIVTTEPKPKATATDAKPKAKATAAAVTSTDAKPKTTAKPAPKDGATAATAGDAAPKPKPKKPPAPKTSETAPATPAALTSQAR